MTDLSTHRRPALQPVLSRPAAVGEPAPSPVRTRGRKARLFCPGCGHASPVDGDWQLSVTPRGVRYGCPACDAVVVTQPVLGSSTP